jgi:hypothetical protein
VFGKLVSSGSFAERNRAAGLRAIFLGWLVAMMAPSAPLAAGPSGDPVQVAQSSNDDLEEKRQEIEAKWQKKIDDFWRLNNCDFYSILRNCKNFRDDAVKQRDAELIALGIPVENKVKCGRLSAEGCNLLNRGVGEIEARWTRIVAEYRQKNGCNGWMTPKHCDNMRKDAYGQRDAEIEELGRQARIMADNCTYRDQQECRALHDDFVRRLVETNRRWWGVMDDDARAANCYGVRSLSEECVRSNQETDLQRLMEIEALEAEILAKLTP